MLLIIIFFSFFWGRRRKELLSHLSEEIRIKWENNLLGLKKSIMWIAPVRLLLDRLILLRLELFADRVRDNLAPVDFRSCYRQLTTKRFECGLWHGLVILTYCLLIVLLAVLDDLDQLFRCLSLIRHDHRLADLLRRDELDVAIFVVVHLKC